MSLSVSRTAAASGILLKTGAVALLAGFSLSIAGSYAPKLLFSGEKVSVNFQGWQWMQGLRFGFDAAPLQAQQVAGSSRIERLIAEIEKNEKAEKIAEAVKASVKVTKTVAKTKRKAGVMSRAKPVMDRVSTIASAPLRGSPDLSEEKARMRGVYRLLRGKFHAALDSKSDIRVALVTTQQAAVVSSQPKQKIRLAAISKKAPTEVKVSEAKIELKSEKMPAQSKEYVPASVVLHEIKPGGPESAAAKTPELIGPPQPRWDEVPGPSTIPLNSMATHDEAEAPRTIQKAATQHNDDPIASLDGPKPEQWPGPPEQQVNTQPSANTQKKPKTSGGLIAILKSEPTIIDYSVNTQAPLVRERQTPPPPPARRKAPGKAEEYGPTSLLEPRTFEENIEDSVQMKMSSALESEQSVSSPNYVEAYRWTEPVAGVSRTWLSRDLGLNRGWVVDRAEGFVPTLSWQGTRSDNEGNSSTPLLSNNSALLLSKVADVRPHPALGMVFGRIPAEWTAELSGRAERPIFVENTFAFLNVEPGARILYITRRNGKSRSGDGIHETAIGIPVLAGTVTFVDVVEPTKRAIFGRVLAADEQGVKGLKGIQVSVVGQPRTAVSDKRGRFIVPNVGTIGSYPVILDTDSTEGFRHRYSLVPSELNAVTLFQIVKGQIGEWIGQVEGGVSEQSGLVVAAVPKLAAKYANSGVELVPGVTHLTDRGGLAPETYVLSGEGEMLAGQTLVPGRSRFVALEVGEGPAVAFIADKAGRRWSELLFAQPGVVNVLGPR